MVIGRKIMIFSNNKTMTMLWYVDDENIFWVKEHSELSIWL